jgi:hypothetical protein
MGDAGFELLLVPDGIGVVPHESVAPSPQAPDAASWNGIIGRELARRRCGSRSTASSPTPKRSARASPGRCRTNTAPMPAISPEAGRHLLGLIEDLPIWKRWRRRAETRARSD